MVLYSKINESLIEDSLKKVVYKTANFLFKYKPSEKTTSGVYMDSLIHFNNIAKKTVLMPLLRQWVYLAKTMPMICCLRYT